MSAEERAAEVAWLRYRDDYMRARALTKRQAASQMRKREFVAGFLADRANAERDERLRAAVEAVLNGPIGTHEDREGEPGSWYRGNRHMRVAIRRALAAADPEQDPRPCRGGNSNICVAEGCYGEACLKAQP